MYVPASLASYAKAAIIALATLGLCAPVAAAPRQTVCTITINSPDERDALRRHLPADDYEVVELVQRGRSDWLDAACRAGTRCDILVISGHFDGGVEFYSDRLDQGESLPVEDLERAACSQTCPALFAALKEVYLFGCNTLSPAGASGMASEVEKVLVRSGRPQTEAVAVAQALNASHASSNRDRMRLLFADVPVLYGFASKAPLGRSAGPLLERHLEGEARHDVGSGRVNAELLKRFAAASMVTARGVGADDPLAAHRRDACALLDTRSTAAAKAAFVHDVLRRDAIEVRARLDALETFVATQAALGASATPLAAKRAIAEDGPARARFLAYADLVDDPLVRARMIDLAHGLGWMSADERRDALVQVLAQRVAAGAGSADVDLACRLNHDGRLTPAMRRLGATSSSTAAAAMQACAGDEPARRQVIDALLAGDEAEGEIAAVLLHHRPIHGAGEVASIVASVTAMRSEAAQSRALAVLPRDATLDAASIVALGRLFVSARTLALQRAIAGVLLRADLQPLGAGFGRTVQAQRRPSPEGRDVIDVLIRRLAAG